MKGRPAVYFWWREVEVEMQCREWSDMLHSHMSITQPYIPVQPYIIIHYLVFLTYYVVS